MFLKPGGGLIVLEAVGRGASQEGYLCMVSEVVLVLSPPMCEEDTGDHRTVFFPSLCPPNHHILKTTQSPPTERVMKGKMTFLEQSRLCSRRPPCRAVWAPAWCRTFTLAQEAVFRFLPPELVLLPLALDELTSKQPDS